MRDIVIEVFNSDRTDMTQLIQDSIGLEVTMHFPKSGTIEMRQDCSHYHIKQGDKINIRVKGRFMKIPAVIKSTHGNVIEFEERTMKANE